jgi:hypothetical protein
MKYIFILALILSVAPVQTYATEIFVRPNAAKPAETSPQPYATKPVEPLAIKPKPAQPIESTTEAPPQDTQAKPTANIADFAQRYYGNCTKQNHPVLKGQNLDMMCSCTAAKIQSSMSVEQMKAMQEQTEAGQFARNQMLLNVYAPCIEFPTRALILDQCLNNAQLKNTLKNYTQTCGCLGDGMASYMKDKAPAAIQEALSRKVDNFDPLRALLESPEFDSSQQQMLQTCITKHELGQ